MNAYSPIKGNMGARGAPLFRRLGPMTQTSSPKMAVVIAVTQRMHANSLRYEAEFVVVRGLKISRILFKHLHHLVGEKNTKELD